MSPYCVYFNGSGCGCGYVAAALVPSDVRYGQVAATDRERRKSLDGTYVPQHIR